MMLWLDSRRRALLSSSVGLIIGHGSGGYGRFDPHQQPQQQVTTSDDIVDFAIFLTEYTPKKFRRAIQQSGGHFLYRGSKSNSKHCDSECKPWQILTSASSKEQDVNVECNDKSLPVAMLCDPPPDLLLPDTYDNDPGALLYFQCLEERLLYKHHRSAEITRTTALPSTGHIGTSDPNVAMQWGDEVVSVWPLGDAISTVWPADRQTFYPNTISATERSTNEFDSADLECRQVKNARDDRLVINSRLNDALRRQDREVLFATQGLDRTQFALMVTGPSSFEHTTIASYSPFVTLQIDYDDDLRRELNKMNYGL